MSIYEDKNVRINNLSEPSIAEASWISDLPVNQSYMQSKLIEVIFNTQCGVWMIGLNETILPGMKNFSILMEDKKLIAKWRK